MKVPPSESENTAWPIAATITAGVRSSSLNLRMNQRTPSPAPGNVSARITRMISTTHKVGMMIVEARSIPFRRPFTITSAEAKITTPVHASCSTNDVAFTP